MLRSEPAGKRELRTQSLTCDLAVIGGGLAGVCCAITAARVGLRVVLVHDRPVLGGNASSEVRLWILGATAHMGNNNRWAREGGVIDEILVENTFRNPEGNPLIVDTVLLEKVVNEPNIQLLLNAAVYDLEKSDPDTIKSVRAFCSQNSTVYEIAAPLFCDASGDGVVGFMAGAAFRMGAESSAEFGEKLAPREPNGALLGHTIYFYTKDTGRPVKFVPPSFALGDISKIPRFRDFNTRDQGCRLWWIEWGGEMDTVHEAEAIKWELWKVVYGVWNYIKNSGEFPDAANMTLEWVGTIPGKRESRRFEGDYMLVQQDIVEQRRHPDAVSFGGWAIDLHPAEGVFSEKPACAQWHSKGTYQIPYRCLYSRNIKNLFLAGRLISASHVAFASARVMATCAHNAQAVGVAAAICRQFKLVPRDLANAPHIGELQHALARTGQFIPGFAFNDPDNLVHKAAIRATSELKLSGLPSNGRTQKLDRSWGVMLPVAAGAMPKLEFLVDAARATRLQVELRASSKPDNHTPDVTLAKLEIPLSEGTQQPVWLDFGSNIDRDRYVFVCFTVNHDVSMYLADRRLTGLLTVCHNGVKEVAKSATQRPPENIGIDTFELWTPLRRPGGQNFAFKIDPPLECFGPENLTNGITRPTNQPNAWVASFDDVNPRLTLSWDKVQTIARVELGFDTDFDHPMESVLMGHQERVMPFCVRKVTVRVPEGASVEARSELKLQAAAVLGENDRSYQPEAAGVESCTAGFVASLEANNQTRRVVQFDPPIATDRLELIFNAPSHLVPAALFDVRCYSA